MVRIQAAVANSEQARMVAHLEGGIGEHPATGWIHRQARGGQPAGRPTACAGQLRWLIAPHLTAQGDGRLLEEPLGQAVGGGGGQVKAGSSQQQLGMGPAGPQGQSHLHRRGAATPHPGLAVHNPLAPGQKRFEGLDGDLSRGGGRERAHIQTEAIKGQGGSALQMEPTLSGIEPHDLGPHKGHLGEGAETAQIQATGRGGLETGHHGGHQAGVAEAAVAADKGNPGGGRAAMGPHQPAQQHQGMGVTATGEQQVVTPGGGIQAACPG